MNAIEQLEATAGGRLASFRSPRGLRLALAGAVAVLYLAGVTGQFNPSPDSAMYLSLARSLARGDGYRFNGEVNTIVTPGLPVVLAGVERLVGPSLWWPNLLAALAGLAAAAMAYLTLARLADRQTAAAVALATALSFPFFHGAHRVLTDVPFCVAFWAAFYSAVRFVQGRWGWLVPLALATLAGVALRAPGGLALGCLSLGLMIDRFAARRRRRYLVAGGAVLAATAVGGAGLFLLARMGAGETPQYATGALVNVGQASHLDQILLALREVPRLAMEMFTGQTGVWPIGVAFVLLVVIGSVGLWRRGRRSVGAVLLLYPISLMVFGCWNSIRARYFLPAQPLAIFAGLEAVLWISQAVAERRRRAAGPPAWLPVVATVFVAVIVACNLPRIVRWDCWSIGWGRSRAFYTKIDHGQYAEFFQIADRIRAECPPDGVVAGDEFSLLHFLTDRNVYYTGPDDPLANRTPADAARLLADLAERPRVAFVVLNVNWSGRPEFREALLAPPAPGLAPLLEPLLIGKRFLFYRCVDRRNSPSISSDQMR